MNFYIGSGMKNRELVNYYSKILKEKGWNQTYNWAENDGEETLEEKRNLVLRIQYLFTNYLILLNW